MTTSSVQDFERLIQTITTAVADKPLDSELQGYLNETFPAHGEVFSTIRQACQDGIAAGWMCKHEAGGIRYGRVIKPGTGSHGFSVDVVQMNNIKGPHHEHPNGEIDMIMPLAGDARFDGQGAGWKVYGPGSAHYPTVSDGEALVLYLLPEGAIEFTRPAK